MLLNFGKSNLIDKAKSQPDKVKDVIEKINSEGPITTFKAIKSKLEQPIPLGYCNVGEIIGIGDDVEGFNIGDKVVSNGPHAEIVTVPKNLCAVIPKNVKDIEAVFTIPASIGLQGIRLLKPTFGETILVIGLGLIGILTAQLLKSNGCRVLGIDTDKNKCRFAEDCGIETIPVDQQIDPSDLCFKLTNNFGVDGVIIAASTSSNDPISTAAKACRKRGRIILIGVSGLNLKRDLFYEKEISFQVSCSYGPGRYDKSYEEEGNDYPIGLVRWTEKRNFEAILSALKSNKLNIKKLISYEFPIKKAELAYEKLLIKQNIYGIVIKYENESKYVKDTVQLNKENGNKTRNSEITIGLIGAGNYSSRFIMPSLFKSKTNLKSIIAESGLRPYFYGQKFNFKYAGTNIDIALKDSSINTIFIATRHDSHADLVISALRENKNIFVEKPLCIKKKELLNIEKTYKEILTNNFKKNLSPPILMVGFNRRFSPYIKLIKKQLDNFSEPKSFIYNCNAGYIPKEHWTQNRNIGGGRLIGEACHFIDLIKYLAGHKIQKMEVIKSFENKLGDDTFTIILNFYDGSIGTVNYFANGNKAYPKEKLEVFFAGKTILLENFRKMQSWGLKRSLNKNSLSQEKGQKECISQFLKAIKNGDSSPINYEDIFEVHSHILNLDL